MTAALLHHTGTAPRTVPFARDLAAYGERVALVTPGGETTYRDLAARVGEVAQRLGDRRGLVLLAGGNHIDTVVVYLAALAAGHPVLLAPGDNPGGPESLAETYDPDLVVTGTGAHLSVDRRHTEGADRLHPDLALLLTTSGSTGSAKLVRLSHECLQANAESIAAYLGIDGDDRAATTLPMHYCYGLSVLNSHLLRGASIILSSRSVADEEFWAEFRAHRGTSFAGVPYTFELLDRVGFDTMRLPHLRYLTQAGGRMAPERVRRYAELGRRDGWELFVMYGQTEATARIAYLPPELAAPHPGCIGVAIPGGSVRLDALADWPEPGTGELVYRGPNVMMGYARSRADLALGRTVHELRTGDIARRTDAGLYEIVGRRSRFAKVFGLRVDLHGIEAALERRGIAGCCADGDGELVVAVEDPPAGDRPGGSRYGGCADLRELAARTSGLPVRAVRICPVAAIPRLANGKPDYPALGVLTRPATPEPARPAAPKQGEDPLRRLFAEVLGRPDVTDDSTFAGLGGDSLSYVEMSVRLEQVLGRLPDQWHVLPIRDLRAAAHPVAGAAVDQAGTRTRSLDTTVALRALAITFVVGTHATLFGLAGGAHLLLGVAGFNFARFHLTSARRQERTRRIARSITRVALASISFIALAVLFTDDYSLANVFLLNYLVGSEANHGWHFWFIESLVYIQVAALAVLAVPALDRLERRLPFALPMALMGLGLVTRYELVPGVDLPTPAVAFWLFALGWAAAKATHRWHRLWVTLAVVATVPGFFGNLQREAVMIVGLLLMTWVSRVPSLALLNRLAGLLAGSSLYIYLTHWQVYPRLTGVSAPLAVAACLAVGVAYGTLVTRAGGRVAHLCRRFGWPELRTSLRRCVGKVSLTSVRSNGRIRNGDPQI